MTFLEEARETLKDTGSTYFFLLKIMIPISIVVKVLDYFGWIEVIGDYLSPAMGVVGLPGDFGLVIATAMIANIYGALIVFFQLSRPGMSLTGYVDMFNWLRFCPSRATKYAMFLSRPILLM